MAVTTKSQLQKEAELPKLRGNRYIAEESRCMSTDEENTQQKIESRTHRQQERSRKQLKKNEKRN